MPLNLYTILEIQRILSLVLLLCGAFNYIGYVPFKLSHYVMEYNFFQIVIVSRNYTPQKKFERVNLKRSFIFLKVVKNFFFFEANIPQMSQKLCSFYRGDIFRYTIMLKAVSLPRLHMVQPSKQQ